MKTLNLKDIKLEEKIDADFFCIKDSFLKKFKKQNSKLLKNKKIDDRPSACTAEIYKIKFGTLTILIPRMPHGIFEVNFECIKK